jgi:hypothetical protein
LKSRKIPLPPPCGVGLPPLHRGEKAEYFIEGIQKSSPPFEKGGREGFWGMPFQKAKLIQKKEF